MDDIKKEDEIFCPECGKPIKRNAVVCVNCGVQVKELKTSLKQEIIIDNPNAKSKTTAVLLSIFLGFWSWLYTYKKDSKKFWTYLILILAGSIIVGLLISKITTSSLVLVNYGTWIWLYFLINASSYIWVLINSIGRPESFYTNYPNNYLQ